MVFEKKYIRTFRTKITMILKCHFWRKGWWCMVHHAEILQSAYLYPILVLTQPTLRKSSIAGKRAYPIHFQLLFDDVSHHIFVLQTLFLLFVLHILFITTIRVKQTILNNINWSRYLIGQYKSRTGHSLHLCSSVSWKPKLDSYLQRNVVNHWVVFLFSIYKC